MKHPIRPSVRAAVIRLVLSAAETLDLDVPYILSDIDGRAVTIQQAAPRYTPAQVAALLAALGATDTTTQTIKSDAPFLCIRGRIDFEGTTFTVAAYADLDLADAVSDLADPDVLRKAWQDSGGQPKDVNAHPWDRAVSLAQVGATTEGAHQ